MATGAARRVGGGSRDLHRSPERRPRSGAPWRWLALGIALLALVVAVLWFSRSGSAPDFRRVANLSAPGNLVVFFGDSITQGYGVRPDESFPALVAHALDVPFVNAGVPGDTMAAGLARLERDVLAHRPRLAVVEFGGNDFLRRVPVEDTLRSLETIVGTLVHEGLMVAILHVNVGMGGDLYLKGYRAVADRHGAVLIPDILRGVLGNPDLKSDAIHPNAKGHRLIADRVITTLRPLLKAAGRRRGTSGQPSSAFPLPGFRSVG
ncbi:MAG: Lipolytic protein family [candidate division NC10 bacterium]|nr:Lipolytic protein family [candidate division NC10 bacterium]